jgi:hypothetical protein
MQYIRREGKGTHQFVCQNNAYSNYEIKHHCHDRPTKSLLLALGTFGGS